MSITEDQLLSIAERVLNRMGIYQYTSLELTSAFKEFGRWKVNFRFQRQFSVIKSVGCFSVDVETGEITGMWLDRSW